MEYQEIKEEAKRAGYRTVIEYLKAIGKVIGFEPKQFIEQMYDNYVTACTLGQQKAFSNERWNFLTDSFENFLDESLKVLELRKQEVKNKRKLKEASRPFPGLYKYKLIDMFDELNPELEVEVDSEELDMYDELISYAEKAIIAYKNKEFEI